MAQPNPTAPTPAQDTLRTWFAQRVPADWFDAAPAVSFDRDEILVVGSLSQPDVGAAATDATRASVREARIGGFREDTRQARIRIADEAEARFGRKVAWGVRCGDVEVLFTTLSVPVMTRLRLSERRVLDTLVDAGVARSRSHALAWCVRLVGEHESDWITRLRDALVHVEQVRSEGPASQR